MKKFISGAILSFGIVLATSVFTHAHSAFADAPGHKWHGGPPNHVEMLDRAVSLTADQKATLDAYLKSQPQQEPLMRCHARLMNLDPSAPDYQQQVDKLANEAATEARQHVLNMAAWQTEVQRVLTDEQKEKLKAFKAGMKERHRHGSK